MLHSVLLTMTNTFLGVVFKSIPAFVPFIQDSYSFSYQFVTRAIAIGSLTTMSCVFVLPQVLRFPANVAMCFECMLCCCGLAVLWYFGSNEYLFVLGVALCFNSWQLQWGSSNAMISSFVSDSEQHLSHKYLSSLSAAWTIATFLFIGVGDIMQIFTFWTYLEVMFAICLALALLNLLLLPRHSVHSWNALHSMSTADGSSGAISIWDDIKVLFGIKAYRIMIGMFILLLFAWSFYYTSFTEWIQDIYDLDQGQLGLDAALIEGIGNVVAIVLISYFSMSGNEEASSCKMRLERMMLWHGFLLLLSMVMMTAINSVQFLQYLLECKVLVYALICGYFCGSEGVVVGAMILSVQETPAAQQARSSAFISMTNSICQMLGALTVGIVYSEYGFKMETPILLGIEVVVVMNCIYLVRTMRQKRSESEQTWINQGTAFNYNTVI